MIHNSGCSYSSISNSFLDFAKGFSSSVQDFSLENLNDFWVILFIDFFENFYFRNLFYWFIFAHYSGSICCIRIASGSALVKLSSIILFYLCLGVMTEGIYRVPGNKQSIEAVVKKFEESKLAWATMHNHFCIRGNIL